MSVMLLWLDGMHFSEMTHTQSLRENCFVISTLVSSSAEMEPLRLIVLLPLLFNSVLSKDLSITILHVNDVHSRFLEANQLSSSCSKSDKEKDMCYGGFARLRTKASEIQRTHPNVLFLSAGDFFQGTVWYTVYKWRVVAALVNRLNLTAMAIGNHEFDDGIPGLVPFLNAAKFPVVASNIQANLEPSIKGKFKSSTVIQLEGRKIGIIGYTTPEAKFLSRPGELIFEDEVEGVHREANRLHKDGVKILIALGHAGYDRDMRLAAEVSLIDVVVGGHSNTFLYSGGTAPDIEKPLGKYPTVVEQPNGRKVPAVQSFAYGKYLGYLNLTFNADGEVTSWAGYPILMNSKIPEDPGMMAELATWGKNLAAMTKKEVGTSRVLLDGRSTVCRLEECNLGNVFGEAMIHVNLNAGNRTHWTDVTMAILNSGGIRSSLDETSAKGSITMDDVLTIAPFQNTIDVIEIKGKYLKAAFEYSVDGYDPTGIRASGKFLQVAGIRVVYDISKPNGSKVKQLDVLCRECRIPKYVAFNENEIYKVAIPTYLATGGDGFKVIKDNLITHHRSGILDSDMLIAYFHERSPIIQGVDGRISFHK